MFYTTDQMSNITRKLQPHHISIHGHMRFNGTRQSSLIIIDHTERHRWVVASDHMMNSTRQVAGRSSSKTRSRRRSDKTCILLYLYENLSYRSLEYLGLLQWQARYNDQPRFKLIINQQITKALDELKCRHRILHNLRSNAGIEYFTIWTQMQASNTSQFELKCRHRILHNLNSNAGIEYFTIWDQIKCRHRILHNLNSNAGIEYFTIWTQMQASNTSQFELKCRHRILHNLNSNAGIEYFTIWDQMQASNNSQFEFKCRHRILHNLNSNAGIEYFTIWTQMQASNT